MIEVRHLTKRYGTHTVISDLTFTIRKGVIYGFLGPNGAGKSTTMNIITGCLGATDSEVLVDGHSISEEPMQAKKLIGYLPEQPPADGLFQAAFASSCSFLNLADFLSSSAKDASEGISFIPDWI